MDETRPFHPRRHTSRLRLRALAVLGALVVVLAGCGNEDGDAAAGVGAAPVQLSGGSTTLELETIVDGVVGAGIVDVRPLAPAEEADGGYSFSVTGGEIRTDTGLEGTVEHDGGLRLRASGARVTLRDLVIDLDRGFVTAVVRGGDRMDILELDLSDAAVQRSEGTLVIENIDASLSTQAAKLIKRRASISGPLGVGIVEEGRSVGTLTVRAETS